MLFIFLSFLSIFSQATNDTSTNNTETKNSLDIQNFFINTLNKQPKSQTNSNNFFLIIKNELSVDLEVQIDNTDPAGINISVIIDPNSIFSFDTEKFSTQESYLKSIVKIYDNSVTFEQIQDGPINISNKASIYFSNINEEDVKLQTK